MKLKTFVEPVLYPKIFGSQIMASNFFFIKINQDQTYNLYFYKLKCEIKNICTQKSLVHQFWTVGKTSYEPYVLGVDGDTQLQFSLLEALSCQQSFLEELPCQHSLLKALPCQQTLLESLPYQHLWSVPGNLEQKFILQ